MAKLTFYVSRRGSDKIECSAEIPHSREYAGFKGGLITVTTPIGERDVEVEGFRELFLDALTISLQNGVRDLLLPKDKGEATLRKRSRIEE